MTEPTSEVPETFDVTGPLPTGTTVLEASAGTGKTFTIAALAARHIADGVGLEHMMMVTFSRAATGELRSRIRERLVTVEEALARTLADDPVSDPDSVTALLISGTREELALRHRRMETALAEFDEATIATTHEFCARMLEGLGVLSQADPHRTLVDGVRELTREAADDLYLAGFADRPRPPFTLDQARTLAEDVVRFSDAALVPDGDDLDQLTSIRVSFAHRVRAEVERRKQARHLFTHDDILRSLRDSLTDPVHGPAAVAKLRERYHVVLVDEFQDTDPVQWDIVRTAFAGHATLILIGDPKQAIYAFRGADVHSYLDAVSTGSKQTLGTNWRSDGPVVQAIDHLFHSAALGDEQIVVHPVEAHHQTARMHGADQAPVPPVRLRYVEHDPQAERSPLVSEVRPRIRQDLVVDVIELLESGATITDAGGPRPVQPGDIAVLVTRNRTAEDIRAALTEAGVPAVSAGASSVLATDIAQDWLTLLRACENPRSTPVRRAALTPFIGWTFADLAQADDDRLASLNHQIRTWARTLDGGGVSALLELIIDSQDLPARLLARTDGERMLTDLRHIGQLLHARMTTDHLGIPALAQWLAEAIEESRRGGEDEQNLRLETDAAAVQVLTVHRAKGLEFGIVLLPDAWDRNVSDDKGQVLRFHPDHGSQRVLDVGGQYASGRPTRRRQALAEEADETLRLLYVALTRARHQVVAWWAPSWNTKNAALHRLLFGERTIGGTPPPALEVTADPSSLTALDPALVRVEAISDRVVGRWATSGTDHQQLDVAHFDRTVDTDWRRTSYTALTRAAHDQHHPGEPTTDSASTAEPDGVREDDESLMSDTETIPGARKNSLPGHDVVSPMAALPAGAEFGTIMHTIYEHTDSSAVDLAAEITAMTAEQLSRTPYPVPVEELAAALLPAFGTPLGPLAGHRTLADIGPDDRMAELDFELPLAGGNAPTSRVTLADVAGVLRRHLSKDSGLAPYPDLLAGDPTGDEVLRGFLTGSIDSVLRVPAEDGTTDCRHVVVDYKSNWLGDFNTELVLADYHHAALDQAMMRAHYPLQALLYSVALHRYLRWRLADYHPHRHLGGILYLFVRGMAGPQTPAVDGVPYGVFSWHPPAELIMELSDLLDEGVGS